MYKIFTVSTVSIYTLLGCAQKGSDLNQMRDEIIEALPGKYSGSIEASPSEIAEITHEFKKIHAPRFGKNVLFYEITSTATNGPGTQRKIFVFNDRPDRRENTMSAYLLTPEQYPEDQIDGWKTLVPDDLRSFPDPCDFRWSKIENGYTGVVRAEDCIFPSQSFDGNIRSNMTYQISGDEFGWEEELLTEGNAIIVSTNGLKLSRRLN